MTDRQGPRGGVLRLRNLAMLEHIRRAEDPAWRERLERQQVVARLGRRFGRRDDPLQAVHEPVEALKQELRRRPLPRRGAGRRGEPGGRQTD